MKINNTAFGRVQNKALQAGVGEALDAVVAKVEDVDKRMLNYTGDWVSGNEYHENDVVTWATDGHLYEVIKAHTSSASFDPDNPEYYKAMTATTLKKYTVSDATNYTQMKALAAWMHDNYHRIIKCYGVSSSGGHYEVTSYLFEGVGGKGVYLTAHPTTTFGAANFETQFRVVEVSNAVRTLWYSFFSTTTGGNVTYANNGPAGFASIDVYYI